MLNIHQSLLFVILLIKKPLPRQTGLIPRDDPWGGMKVDQGGRSTGRQREKGIKGVCYLPAGCQPLHVQAVLP